MAKAKSPILFDATVDEVGHALLLRVFLEVSPSLGHYLQTVLSDIYGEERWRRRAGRCLTPEMKKRLEMTRKLPLKDMYLMCELIVDNLEELIPGWVDIDGVGEEGFRLERLAVDVDNVSRTRTALFHGCRPSAREIHRCLYSLVRLLRRIPNLVAMRLDELHSYLMVREAL